MKKVLISLLLVMLLVSCSQEADPSPVIETPTESPETTESVEESTEPETEEPEVETTEPETTEPEEEVEEEESLKDYVLSLENKTLIYEGGHEFAEMTEWLEYHEDNRFQVSSLSTAVGLTRVYEVTDDQVKVIFEEATDGLRFNYLDTDEQDNSYVLLQGPIEVGTTWEDRDQTHTITAVGEEVTVPAGTYQTIVVSTEDTTLYYAKEVGLVKMVVDIDDFGFTQELVQIMDGPTTYGLDLWNLSEDGVNLTHEMTSLTLDTNDNLREGLARIFIDAGLFPEGTKIQSLYVNETDGDLYLDVSSDIYREGLGPMAESNMVQAVVNTLTGYFHKDRMYFWVDGEAYNSHELTYKKGVPLQRVE